MHRTIIIVILTQTIIFNAVPARKPRSAPIPPRNAARAYPQCIGGGQQLRAGNVRGARREQQNLQGQFAHCRDT